MDQPEPQLTKNQQTPASKRDWKKIIISAFIVALAIICFSLSIFAMSSAVMYFGYMFTSTDQLIAKAYLKLYYSWFMALTYMSIFGLVIVVANTFVHFTKFNQKQKIIWLHGAFYLALLISGIVALVGNAQYIQKMNNYLLTSCSSGDYECKLGPNFVIYRGQVMSYFIGYCVCFLAYAILYHYSAYQQKREAEMKNLQKVQTNNSQAFDKENTKQVNNNLSSISIQQ